MRYVYGLELTWCVSFDWSFYLDNHYTIERHFVRVCTEAARRLKMKGGKISTDVGTTEVELHSPLVRNYRQLRGYYDAAMRAAARFNLKTHSDKAWSGGGHLHVTPKRGEWVREFVDEVFWDIGHRPYLNWAFNEPEDNDSANCVRYGKDMFGGQFHGRGFKSKGHAVSYNGTTIEFRIFDAPRGYWEQRLHVRFVDAYLAWMQRRYRAGKRVRRNFVDDRPLTTWTLRAARREFNALLRQIGLDPRDYRRNYLAARFSYGPRVLK